MAPGPIGGDIKGPLCQTCCLEGEEGDRIQGKRGSQEEETCKRRIRGKD